MAIIHNEYESINDKIIKEDKNLLSNYLVRFGILIIGAIGFFISLRYRILILEIIFLCVSFGSVYSFYKLMIESEKQKAILSSGSEGENRSISYLQLLDNSFHIIPNAVVYYENKKSEMDNIIIGPTGLYIIEVKNYKGIIKGKTSEKELTHIKTDDYGNTFTSTFYNPCKQVGTHRYRLNGFLNEKGIKQEINIAVLFINSESQVYIDNDDNSDCLVFSNPLELNNYITSNPVVLTSDETKHIIEVIVENIGIHY